MYTSCFLVCAESAVSILNKPMKKCYIKKEQKKQLFTYAKFIIADSAQPKKYSASSKAEVFG